MPVLGLALAGCARNPATGELQPALISQAEEIEMGREAAAEVEQLVGLVPEEPLQAYLRRMGADLAAVTERPGLPWTFGVVDDPTPNAFALPGGHIYVTRGLLGYLDSEAELASVLGHEVGHVTARHAVAALSRARLAQLGLLVGGIFFPAAAQYGGWTGLGIDLLFLEYGRDAELQADELAFRYAVARDYDAREMVDVFGTLKRLHEVEGSSPLPSWLATHPAPDTRIRNLESRIASLGSRGDSLRRGREAYLERIDGVVYGVNPRNGFFRDRVFLHPEFRFRLELPEGWQRQNLAAAVVAISPGRNAVIQLTLARERTAEESSRRFLAEPHVRALETRREIHHGVPAVVSAFRAEGEQGTIRGLVAFFDHRGRVFQLLAYTPALHFARYEGGFRTVLGSFAPLDDPEILALQPRRMRVTRLEEAMSLAEFHRRHPSTIPLEDLLVLNQLADPNAQLPKGTLVKRVVGAGLPPS
ncbi:MAG TPA: M48 family metalloprotease [Longimicrobiaceae bacterium]